MDLQVTATTTAKGVIDQSVVLHHRDRAVPGVVLTPEGAPAKGLILIGHGGVAEKRNPVPLYVGRAMVRRHGFAAALIDAPFHGERAIDGQLLNDESRKVFFKFMQDPAWVDVMVEDWKAMTAATSAMVGLPDDAPLGYWGLSMGCHFGLPFVAAEPRIGAAVLGLFPGYARHFADAATISCPVLFLLQWHDELFDHDEGVKLYDALGSRQKKLAANAGRHSSVPREQLEETLLFLANTLNVGG